MDSRNKKPKDPEKIKALSAMAPTHAVRASSAAPVESEQFAAQVLLTTCIFIANCTRLQAEANVAPDELFFYRYFKDKSLEKPKKKQKKVSAEDGADDENLADVIGEAVGEGAEKEEEKDDDDDDDFPESDSDPGDDDAPAGCVALHLALIYH